MKRLIVMAAALALTATAACSDRGDEDAVVEQSNPGAPPVPATPAQADAVSGDAVLAFNMTRDQLEGATLVAHDGTDLGSVQQLVLDAQNRLTHLIIELEAPGALNVVVPLADLSPIQNGADADLTTALTAAQLQALPAYAPQ
nr:PRC-barrel domain-containing protein [uncultured Brevundimonas sp.]